MNIFFLNSSPSRCAEMHNDKHVVKMILEYAQLLSTAHRVLDGTVSEGISSSGRKQSTYRLSDNRESVLYRATHINHPSAIWVRQSASHYAWLYSLFCSLLDEYTYRYNKVHATSRLKEVLFAIPNNIPQVGWQSDPTPAMPDEYRVDGDSISSYWNYYRYGKSHIAKWTNRPTPVFVT